MRALIITSTILICSCFKVTAQELVITGGHGRITGDGSVTVYDYFAGLYRSEAANFDESFDPLSKNSIAAFATTKLLAGMGASSNISYSNTQNSIQFDVSTSSFYQPGFFLITNGSSSSSLAFDLDFNLTSPAVLSMGFNITPGGLPYMNLGSIGGQISFVLNQLTPAGPSVLYSRSSSQSSYNPDPDGVVFATYADTGSYRLEISGWTSASGNAYGSGFVNVQAVPEPSGVLLLMLGLYCFSNLRRYKAPL